MDTIPGIEKIREGMPIPHTRAGTRPIVRVDWESGIIRMKTGRKQSQTKYTTVLMVKWMYDLIQSGQPVYREALENKFPEESKQGTCVFSMTGGILEFLGHARCVKHGRRNYFASTST